jgi:hypothetical protein
LLVHRKFYVQELPRELPGPIVLGQGDGATEKAGKKGRKKSVMRWEGRKLVEVGGGEEGGGRPAAISPVEPVSVNTSLSLLPACGGGGEGTLR